MGGFPVVRIKIKKKTLQKAGMVYYPFFFLSVSHNTTSCIVTQGLTGLGAQGRVGLATIQHAGHDTGHDTAKGGHDKAGSTSARRVSHDTAGLATIQATTRSREATTRSEARGGKIGPTRWASPVRPKLGPGWAIKLLARKKSGQIWPRPNVFCLEKTIWPDRPGF